MALTQISTEGIKNGTITTADLAADAVTAEKILDDAVRSEHIADDAVGSAQIADGAVTTSRLAGNAVTSAKIADGAIVNADINASAAIAGTKISPDFGSQNITTTGQVFSSYATLTAVNPTLTFNDSDNNPDYTINVNSGVLKITDSTNTADRLVINTD